MARNVLTLRQLQNKLGGVHHKTVYRWMETGHIPRSFQICGRTYWDEAEVDEFIDRHKAERKAPEAA